MEKIIRAASAGTMESSDAYVEIAPGSGSVEISLESVVKGQFGAQIEAVVREVLAQCGITDAKVAVTDRGALDCVLRARVETAVVRGKGEVPRRLDAVFRYAPLPCPMVERTAIFGAGSS